MLRHSDIIAGNLRQIDLQEQARSGSVDRCDKKI